MKVIYLKKTTNGIVFDFRLNLLARHLEGNSTHRLGSSYSREKKIQAQENLKTAMAAAMSDNAFGNFNIFNRDSFQNFFQASLDFAKNYRENPKFLSFHPKAMMRLVEDRSKTMMEFFKEAVSNSIQQEQEILRQIIDAGDKDVGVKFKDIPRVIFSVFLDYKWFGGLKKNLGAVTMTARIYDTEKNDWKQLIEMPLELFNIGEDGTTAEANSRHFKRAVEAFFRKEDIRFCGAAFDGGILDKHKKNLLPKLAECGHSNFKVTSFSCACHGNALQPPLSIKRIMEDFNLPFEEAKLPKQRLSVDAIWFGNGDEKNKNEKNIRTLSSVMKELSKRSKRREITYGDYVELLRFQDDRRKEKPSRNNSIHLRWKAHYFNSEPELPKECPLKIIRMSDKKLRRHHQRVIRVLDNMPYIKIAFKHEDYRHLFPEDANMDGDFQNMLGQWAALTCYLWSLNDSSNQGYNCSPFRSLLIVLRANLEDSNGNGPLDNFLLRFFIIIFLNLL